MNKDRIGAALLLIAAILLFISPFALGWWVWSVLAPATFWENIAAVILALVVAAIEGVAAYLVGYVVLNVAFD